MLPERHRLAVTIGGAVADGQQQHEIPGGGATMADSGRVGKRGMGAIGGLGCEDEFGLKDRGFDQGRWCGRTHVYVAHLVWPRPRNNSELDFPQYSLDARIKEGLGEQ